MLYFSHRRLRCSDMSTDADLEAVSQLNFSVYEGASEKATWSRWENHVKSGYSTCTFSCICVDTDMYIILSTTSKTPAFDI